MEEVPKIIKYDEIYAAATKGYLDKYVKDYAWRYPNRNSNFSIIGILLQPTISEAEMPLLRIEVHSKEVGTYETFVEWADGYCGLTVGDEYHFSGYIIDRKDGHGLCLVAETLTDITFLERRDAEKSN